MQSQASFTVTCTNRFGRHAIGSSMDRLHNMDAETTCRAGLGVLDSLLGPTFCPDGPVSHLMIP